LCWLLARVCWRGASAITTERLGFNPSHILTGTLCCLDESHYPEAKDAAAYYGRLFERLHAIPGVESVSGASDLPLRHFQGAGVPYQVRGAAPMREHEERIADFFFIEPKYFETLQIPIVRGARSAITTPSRLRQWRSSTSPWHGGYGRGGTLLDKRCACCSTVRVRAGTASWESPPTREIVGGESSPIPRFTSPTINRWGGTFTC
jgi:hypothetical protein